MSYLAPEKILDENVQEFFKDDAGDYTQNLTFFDRADAWFKRVARSVGVLDADIPDPITEESAELLDLYISHKVCQRKIGIEVTLMANGQKQDMWADKAKVYKTALDDRLEELDKYDILGIPADVTESEPDSNTIQLFRG